MPFPEIRMVSITISLEHSAGKNYSLTIADNGKGLPGDLDYTKSRSMGMSLMQGLSEDMNGVFFNKK